MYIFYFFVLHIHEEVYRTKPSDKLFEVTVRLVVLYRFNFLVTKNLSNLAYMPWSMCLGWLEHLPVHQGIVGLISIPSQGTYPGCGFDPWPGLVQEGNQSMLSLFLYPRHPLPPSLPLLSPSLFLPVLLLPSLSLCLSKSNEKVPLGGNKKIKLAYISESYPERDFFFFGRLYLFHFLERRREKEREGEKHQCVVASHAPC